MVKVIEFAAFYVLWMLFVDSTATGELIGAAVGAAFAVLAFEVAKHADPLCFRPPFKAWVQIWRVPGMIIQGTWVLVVDLARRITGRPRRSVFLFTPFRSVGTDSRCSAKRALAIIYVTLPPNFLIIGVDREKKLMLYHQIRKDPVPEIIHRLDAA